MSDADFLAMATGASDPMKLFSSGKLKISGDVMASQKLGFLKKLTPEMVRAETDKRLGSSGVGSPAPAAAAVSADHPPGTAEIFAVIRDHVERNPDLVGKVGNVYLWNITAPNSAWLLDLKNGQGAVTEGGGAADCTLEITEADFLALTQGKADAMKLFTTGKLKISGNVMASQKLEFLKKLDPARGIEVVAKLRGAGGGAAAAPAAAAPAATTAAQAPAIFAALDQRLAANPGLKDEVHATLHLKVTGPDLARTYALGGTTEATLTLADADLAALASGKATIKSLFQHGKLRVDGDVSVAHRLGILNKLI
jgi:3-hydroxyacyl-CoA dehydrogenase/3a,7a,12a-trihydroxy-5b-cholest-24-enoyl-CoA hydratase